MSAIRKKHFDCIRALCMIWIICIWHMGDYSVINVAGIVGSDITMGVLSMYMFISGSLSGKYDLSDTKSALLFLKKDLFDFIPCFLFLAFRFILLIVCLEWE